MSTPDNSPERTALEPEALDRLDWKDEMFILVLADHDGEATSKEMKDELKPILGGDNYSPKFSYRLKKLSHFGDDDVPLVRKEKSDETAKNGEPRNKAVLTNETRTWLYEYRWIDDLRERRENLEALSEERRLRVLQQEITQLEAKIDEFQSVAEDSEAFENALDDAEIVSLKDRLDSIAGEIGHVDRRLRELEDPDGDATVPGYKHLDERMNTVESRVDSIDDSMDAFVENWTGDLQDLHSEIRAVKGELADINGENAQHGDIDDIWETLLIHNYMLTNGIGIDMAEFSNPPSSEYGKLSKHVFDGGDWG